MTCDPLMTAGAVLMGAAVCDEVTHDGVTDMAQPWTTDTGLRVINSHRSQCVTRPFPRQKRWLRARNLSGDAELSMITHHNITTPAPPRPLLPSISLHPTAAAAAAGLHPRPPPAPAGDSPPQRASAPPSTPAQPKSILRKRGEAGLAGGGRPTEGGSGGGSDGTPAHAPGPAPGPGPHTREHTWENFLVDLLAQTLRAALICVASLAAMWVLGCLPGGGPVYFLCSQGLSWRRQRIAGGKQTAGRGQIQSSSSTVRMTNVVPACLCPATPLSAPSTNSWTSTLFFFLLAKLRKHLCRGFDSRQTSHHPGNLLTLPS